MRFAVAADAVELLRRPGAPRPPAPLPGPRLRLGVPRHERPPPLVLDGDVRQPREDAPDVRAQARRASRGCVAPACARKVHRAVGADEDVVLEPDAAALGVVDAGLDGEDHALAQRRVRGRDEERRLVDLGADRVAGAVQAGAELRMGLDDHALGGVDVARGVAEPRGGDRVVVGLLDDGPRARRPVARRAGGRAAGHVAPVAVELRGDVGDDRRRPPAACARPASRGSHPRASPKRMCGPGLLAAAAREAVGDAGVDVGLALTDLDVRPTAPRRPR